MGEKGAVYRSKARRGEGCYAMTALHNYIEMLKGLPHATFVEMVILVLFRMCCALQLPHLAAADIGLHSSSLSHWSAPREKPITMQIPMYSSASSQ